MEKLRSMSDRELDDIGLDRSQVGFSTFQLMAKHLR